MNCGYPLTFHQVPDHVQGVHRSSEWALACFLIKLMLLQGTGTAADIDLGMILSDNHPIGPLKRADLIGQPIASHTEMRPARLAPRACKPIIPLQQRHACYLTGCSA